MPRYSETPRSRRHATTPSQWRRQGQGPSYSDNESDSDDSLDDLISGRSRLELPANKGNDGVVAAKGSEKSPQDTKIDTGATNTPAANSEAGTPEPVAALTTAHAALIAKRRAAMQKRRSGAIATPKASSVRSARSITHSAVTPGARTSAQRAALIEKRKRALARQKKGSENSSPSDDAQAPVNSRRHATSKKAPTPSQRALIERRQAAQRESEAISTRARSMRAATSARAGSTRAMSMRRAGRPSQQLPPRPGMTPRSLLTPREQRLYAQKGKTPRKSAPTPREKALKERQESRRRRGFLGGRVSDTSEELPRSVNHP